MEKESPGQWIEPAGDGFPSGGLPERSFVVYDRNGPMAERMQWVISERAVTLFLNGRELVTLLCAGHHLRELAAGFLRAEGFLASKEDLLRMEVDSDGGRIDIETRSEPDLAVRLWSRRTITSGCGKGSAFYYALDALLSKPVAGDVRITPAQIFDRVEDLHRLSETYRRTHGVHNVALAVPERVLLFRDDIGRHNAVDMIVGHVFLRDIRLSDKLLITTGRLTSEIILKAGKVRMPVIVSRNTATSLAIDLAASLNITLIGYVRGGKFTVYCGGERVTSQEEVGK